MSETAVRERPFVDMDDFERRMRQHSAGQSSGQDPLAELARLVGEQPDPFDDMFARDGGAPVQEQAGRREPGFRQAQSPRFTADFAAIEAGLRGAIPAHAEPAPPPSQTHEDYSDAAYYEQQPEVYGEGALEPAYAAPPPSARSRRPVYLIAATIAVGVIGIGTAFALKGHIARSPGDIKTIMADAGPTKIQPPADASADQSGQDSALLGGKGNQPAPSKLASSEEQPVDLSQAVQENTARDAAQHVTDASSVPVPLSPGQVQTAMADPHTTVPPAGSDLIGEQLGGFNMASAPAPKRVKSVSVRPDGTILPNDQPPAAAMPAPRQSKTSDRVGPIAKPSTPKTATPKGATAKTTTRVAAPAQTASIDDAAGDTPVAPKPAKAMKKAKPQRVASNDAGTQEVTDAASPSPAATSEASGGGFAVQLAAPGSEADAKSASSKLSKKFAGALGGRHLGFFKAQANGKSVYRVRVSSLSKGDAVSLCEKLKADGGSCFVAKN